MPWPPRPAELASWPLAWRERWGWLANDLEARGSHSRNPRPKRSAKSNARWKPAPFTLADPPQTLNTAAEGQAAQGMLFSKRSVQVSGLRGVHYNVHY